MSVGFKAVQWNRDKLVYDAVLLAGVALFIGAFMLIKARTQPPANALEWIDLRINALGTCAFARMASPPVSDARACSVA